MQEPQWTQPTDTELDQIHEKARQYKEKFERSGVKGPGVKGAGWREQIRGIIREVENLDEEQSKEEKRAKRERFRLFTPIPFENMIDAVEKHVQALAREEIDFELEIVRPHVRDEFVSVESAKETDTCTSPCVVTVSPRRALVFLSTFRASTSMPTSSGLPHR